jgi:lipid-binding SYLF domain-containing protein
MKTHRAGLALCSLFFTAALVTAQTETPTPTTRQRQRRENAQKEVDAARQTVDNFAADPSLTWFRDHARESRGLFICSMVVKVGFIFGGSGGRCVLVTKSDPGFAGPAFYSMGTASAGFQAGVQRSEIILLAMTQKAVDSLMSRSFKLGAGASVSAGPVGTGTGATTTDFVSFSRSRGIYGGVNVSGASIRPTSDFNNAFYGRSITPIEIIVKRAATSPGADALIASVSKLFGVK